MGQLARVVLWHGREKRGLGDPNPFVDPEGYKAHVDQYEKSFETALAGQGQAKGGRGQGKAKQDK